MLSSDLVSLTFRAITVLSLALSLAIASFNASAKPADVDVELERVFWECDYTATIRMFNSVEAATCSELSEELKVRKFAGSFEQMLAWWSANKTAEHRKVAERVDGRFG